MSWTLPDGVSFDETAAVWVGAADAPMLQQLQLEHSTAAWSVLDPSLLQSRQADAAPEFNSAAAASDRGPAPADAPASASAAAAPSPPQTAAERPVAADSGGSPDRRAWQHGIEPGVRRTLQRRYYLVEKVLIVHKAPGIDLLPLGMSLEISRAFDSGCRARAIPDVGTMCIAQARNANIVGILVGTLGVAGYLDAIENLRALVQK